MQMQLLAILGSVLLQVQTSPSPVDARFRVDAKLPDVAEMLTPAAVHLDGWLGDRVTVNAKNRLVHIDMEPLLAGFRKKPGSHPWIGEHIGKWLHAATLAWVNTGDPVLRQKLDRTVAELVARKNPMGISAPIFQSNALASTRERTGTSGRTSTISSACSPTIGTRATSRRWPPAARWAIF